jgi:hypothetical protein
VAPFRIGIAAVCWTGLARFDGSVEFGLEWNKVPLVTGRPGIRQVVRDDLELRLLPDRA